MKTPPAHLQLHLHSTCPAAGHRPWTRPAAAVLAALGSLLPAWGAPPQVTVTLSPPEAVAAGAAWRVIGEAAWRASGLAYTNLATGTQFLEFKPVDGWETPTLDTPLTLAESTTTRLTQAYPVTPLHPVRVTATPGGFVQSEAWAPQLFQGLLPPGSDGSPASRNADWDRALATRPRTLSMPRENTGWRVRLHALAAPGYQFVGWTGDVTGTRNPLLVLARGTRRIQAQFARPSGGAPASQSAESFASPGTTAIHAQFSLLPGQRLETLRWQPSLPPGWRLVGADGLAGPTVQGTEVVFTRLAGQNPVQFNLQVAVPAGETGLRTVEGLVEYAFPGDPTPTRRPVTGLTAPVLPSAAATLGLSLEAGRAVLAVEGNPGRTYVIEQSPTVDVLPAAIRRWVHLGDLTLPASPARFVDPLPFAPDGQTFYRATLVE